MTVEKVISIGQILDKLYDMSVFSMLGGAGQLTLRCMPKKLHRNRAKFWTNSWSLELLLGYVVLRSSDTGIISAIVLRTSVNILTSCSS